MERVVRFCERLQLNIENNLRICKIKTRPNASNGLWVGFLLPICLLVCSYRYDTSYIYQLTCACSAGQLLLTFLFIIFTGITHRNISKWNDILVPSLLTALLCLTFLNCGILTSFMTGFFACTAYKHALVGLLQRCPLSFTLGEAMLIAQAIALFLYSSSIDIYLSLYDTPESDQDIITNILELGTLSVLLVVITLYKMRSNINITKFLVVVSLYIALMLAILHFTLQRSPILWILTYVFSDLKRILMVVYWMAASALGGIAIATQTSTGSKASTARRKIFHLLAVAVYLPGLIFECNLIYLASGIALAALIALETVRKLNLGWFSETLNDGFYVFADEKDVGNLSLTPIYLLLGIATPLFIHPSPCNSGDAALLITLSGILSVGVGDTAASYFGSKYGKLKWPGSAKSFEGSLASIVSQMLTLFLVSKLGFIYMNNSVFVVGLHAILINSMVEATTDQVDNLTLPLVTFAILIFT